MSDDVILTSVSIEINDEVVEMNGGTLTYKDGKGEVKVTSASKGGRPTVVAAQDINTMVGMIKFEAPAKIENMQLSADIKSRAPATNTIRFSGTTPSGARIGRVMSKGSYTIDPEITVNDSGMIPYEFHGMPLAAS